MSRDLPSETPFYRRLSFRVLAPTVAFTLLLGAAVIGYNLYTIGKFAEEQAATRLRLHAETVRQIAEDHRDKPRLLSARGETDGRARRIEALLAIEDFARVNGLQVRILDQARPGRITLGGLGVELPEKLPDGDGVRSFAVGERGFRVHTIAVAPWNWQVSLIGDARAYSALRDELLQGARVAAAALIGATLLFLVYLVSLLRRPTIAIIDDLKADRPPSYHGIAEFEFLGRSIADLMVDLREKSAALSRHGERLEYTVAERTAELTAANRKLTATNQQLKDAYQKLESSQQQLLQSEKLAAIGQLAAGVAHEINNPVGYVNSNLGQLGDYVRKLLRLIDAYERRTPDEEIESLRRQIDLDYLRSDFEDLFSESQSGLARVRKIVLDLRDFSRVGNHEWVRADLHKGLDSTLNIVTNELKYKAKVVKEFGELPEIECLPSELNQVFLNLLVNAGHAIREQGEITIRTRREGDEAIVEIADTGCGIPPDVLPRIFDPFFTTKPAGQGTGLGLALSFGIIQKHHGRIEVDSVVDQGTTFRIRLPLAQPPDAAADVPAHSAPAA